MRSLQPAAAAFDDALRVLDRGLAEARGPWNDATRLAFDHRYAEPVLADGARAASELRQLARDLDAALWLLDSSA